MTNLEDQGEHATICLHDMFEEIVLELSTVIHDKDISITTTCDDSTVVGNVELLYRAFYNLIENAIKYNQESGTVVIDVEKIENKKVKIVIKDTGIGIPDDVKKYIFEPFYRVDKSRSRAMGGVGLGLSIVDEIIKIHGGTIAIYDNVQGGSCFEIVI